ncbi:hypothetical protein ERJ75_000137200 [Trypanosoma vivax]|uniref:Uncharacterized protein n=1 Tax=Trypanosoma vivax (strain Y486) TaxID=1055687 RepID=G0TW91_TRYVY|nr:hypothetical protein TRVL_02514 [Trypanosoma vivax]KAH8619640.1 hypothetical protein ERJ75_000137200 [Trypanosoma vivax]CCC48229.1 hypothetical protein TVY486_0600200 [Trypanosoma vivax Y486]
MFLMYSDAGSLYYSDNLSIGASRADDEWKGNTFKDSRSVERKWLERPPTSSEHPLCRTDLKRGMPDSDKEVNVIGDAEESEPCDSVAPVCLQNQPLCAIVEAAPICPHVQTATLTPLSYYHSHSFIGQGKYKGAASTSLRPGAHKVSRFSARSPPAVSLISPEGRTPVTSDHKSHPETRCLGASTLVMHSRWNDALRSDKSVIEAEVALLLQRSGAQCTRRSVSRAEYLYAKVSGVN